MDVKQHFNQKREREKRGGGGGGGEKKKKLVTHLESPAVRAVSVGSLSETCGVILYGSGWRKDAVNQCWELEITDYATPLRIECPSKDCGG